MPTAYFETPRLKAPWVFICFTSLRKPAPLRSPLFISLTDRAFMNGI